MQIRIGRRRRVAGSWAPGIAQVCAEAGYQVVVREVSDELLKKGLGSIESFLDKGVEKGKVTRRAQGGGAGPARRARPTLAALAPAATS